MTSLSSIFKESFSYPAQDLYKVIILGVLFVIVNLEAILYGVKLGAFGAVLGIISFIVDLIIVGYGLSIIKDSLNNSDIVPDLNITSDLVGGIKALIMSIVYYIIPFILILIVAILSGGINSIIGIASFVSSNPGVAIPTTYIASLGSSIIITGLIAIILFILFSLLSTIGLCRLAKYGSLGESLNIGQVIKDIGKIGWANFIGWFIIYILITIVFFIVSVLVGLIPYVGMILASLILFSFYYIFSSRAIALIYKSMD